LAGNLPAELDAIARRDMDKVYKGKGATATDNKVFLLRGLVRAIDQHVSPPLLTLSLVRTRAQNDAADYDLPGPVFSFMTVVVLLHELTHALTKHLFGVDIVTPLGVGPAAGGFGESGWRLEDDLFGFEIAVEAVAAQRGNMRKAEALIATEGTRSVALCEYLF
jgi:hypothetical protein